MKNCDLLNLEYKKDEDLEVIVQELSASNDNSATLIRSLGWFEYVPTERDGKVVYRNQAFNEYQSYFQDLSRRLSDLLNEHRMIISLTEQLRSSAFEGIGIKGDPFHIWQENAFALTLDHDNTDLCINIKLHKVG